MVGGLYGMFSSGLTLVLGSTRVVNFAHGDFVTLGMYGAVVLAKVGLNPLESLIPVGLIMFGIGAGVYLIALRPSVTGRGRIETQGTGFSHVQLVITLGLSLVIENVLQMIFSPNSQSVTGFLGGTARFGFIYIPDAQVAAFIIAVVVFAVLHSVLRYTTYGKALQATVDSPSSAALVGINAGRIYLITFGLGSALAAIAGVILVTYYPAVPTTGSGLLTIAFVVIVLGGLGNPLGAFLSGIIVGVVEQLTATYASLSLQDVGVYVVFLAALLLFPRGILTRGRAAL